MSPVCVNFTSIFPASTHAHFFPRSEGFAREKIGLYGDIVYVVLCSRILGIHFEVDMLKVLQPFVSLALRSFFHAVDTMLHKRKDNEAAKTGFNFSLNCQGIDSNHRWKDGPEFYRSVLQKKSHLRDVVIQLRGQDKLVKEARKKRALSV